MRKNSKPIYNTYRHGALPDMNTQKAYEIYRRLMGGEMALVNELMSYFNKGMLDCVRLYPTALAEAHHSICACRFGVFFVVSEEHAIQWGLFRPRRIAAFPRSILPQCGGRGVQGEQY